MDPVLARLERLESRIAISELRSRYCWYTTRGEREHVVGLFTPDCIFENHRSPESAPVSVRGQKALSTHLSHMRPGRRIPIVTNEITLIDGDNAKGTCVMQSMGDDPFCGHYIDHLRRINGVWLFASRIFFPYWPIFRPSADGLDPTSDFE